MEKNTEIVSFRDVSFSYNGGPDIIRGVNFVFHEKDIVGIIGPNGGGKTTLLKLMLGLLKPTTGDIKLFGSPPAEGRQHVGYVPQYVPFDRNFPATVMKVVLMGRIRSNYFFGEYSDSDRKKAAEALQTVEMEDLAERPIGELSHGQKQRVFIARALVSKPKLLLLDEPTSSVDAVMQKTVYELLNKLKKQAAVILVTHDIGVISKNVEKIACMNGEFYYHNSKEFTAEDLSKAYKCPVELIAHGVPHRVLKEHKNKNS